MGLDPADLMFRLEKRFGIEMSQAEGIAVLFGTAGHIHRYLITKLRGKQKRIPKIEPLLLEVSRAVNQITGWWRLTLTQDLNRRFPPDTRAANWIDLATSLGVALPPLEKHRNEDCPHIPRCCDSAMALSYWIAEHHPERVEWLAVTGDRFGESTARGWTDDEIWYALRECICDALGVAPEEVTYDARLVEDLGMN